MKKRRPALYGGKAAFRKQVPITKPTIPSISALKGRYLKVLKSGMITNSTSVQEFEQLAKKYLGAKHAVAVNSCTSGLMLVMKALGLKGEIIVPSFTFHATAHAAVWNGLRPIFADCDPYTYNIDLGSIEKLITPRTSAILAVHIFGNPADAEALESLAAKHGLRLIFDAAHGFGSKYKGKSVGVFGDAEVFSLSPTKLLTAGEGGIVATNNDDIAKNIMVGRNYGDPGTYDPEFSGLSARMSEFSGLLGIESLEMLEMNVTRRNEMANLYKESLFNLPGINFQKIEKGNRSSYKDFSILIDEHEFGMSRNALCDALMAENVVVKKYFFPPVHTQKAFKKFFNSKQSLSNTAYVSDNILSLPLYSHIEKETVQKICRTVHDIHKWGKL